MKDLFTIGEVASLFGLNIRTLRYYYDIRFLEPEYVGETTNYRYYSTRQFERLNTIKYLRALDISTQQIGEFLRHRDVDVILSILMGRQQEIQRKKKELELIGKRTSNRPKQIDNALHSNREEIVVKTFPPRHLVMLKKEITMLEDLEYPIQGLERTHHLDVAILLGKVGVSVSREYLLSRSYGNFTSVFVVLEKGNSYNGTREILPQGRYAAIRFQGTHQEAPGHYDRLLEYLEQTSAALSGDSLKITMINSDVTGDSSRFMTELQVPFQ